MKKYTIISNKDVDVSEIDAQLQVETLSVDNIPDRAAQVENPHSESKRITSYFLTEDEVAALKNDPRVQDVVAPTKATPGLFTEQRANFFRQPITHVTNFNRFKDRLLPKKYPDPDNSHVNWGLERCTNKGIRDYTYWDSRDSEGNRRLGDMEPGSSGTGINYQTIHHGVSGEGVDIVIMDTGVQVNHPDLLDADGNSRVQQIDWYSYSNTLTGTLPEMFYVQGDPHGTHVACTAAGRKNGWAKEAHIYVMNILGVGALADISEAYELMLAWHRAKTDPTSPHYTGRPTVINMSWGYHSKTMNLPNPDVIHFRGNDYQGPNWDDSYASQTYARYFDLYALTPPSGRQYDIAVQVPEIDALTQELVDAGATVCIAAGNRGDVCVKDPNHQDYNNRLEWNDPDIDDMHYMRAGSPFADGALFVGNLSNICLNSTFDSPHHPTVEMVNPTSGRGQCLDILAPGTKIRAGMPEWNNVITIKPETFVTRHFVDIENPDNQHTEGSISGTSMATPQVSGVAALHLCSKPNLTPAQVKTRILEDAEEVTNLGDLDWLNHRSSKYTYRPPDHTPIRFGKGYTDITQSAQDITNKVLHSRYSKPPIEMKGAFSLTSTTGQGTAGPDYTTHSTITAASATMKRFSGMANEITLTAKTAADTPATKSVGNVKLFALHGIFEQVKDNLDGTYTAVYHPKLGDTSVTETITAAIRPHGEPKYKTLTNSVTITLTPTEVRSNSVVIPMDTTGYVFTNYRYSNSNTGNKIYVDYRDADGLGVPTRPMYSIGTFQNTDTIYVPRPAVLRPGPGKDFLDYYAEYGSGRHIVWARMPETPQSQYEQTLELNTGNGFSTWSKSPVSDVLPYSNFEETTIIEAWPPAVPADGKALMAVRCIPKTDTGEPQKTYIGQFLFSRLNTSDEDWFRNVDQADIRKGFYLENWKKEQVESNDPTAVIHRQDFKSSEVTKGAFGARLEVVGTLPGLSTPPFEKQVEAEFTNNRDAYRAYYSIIHMETIDATSATFTIELKRGNSLRDTGIYNIRLWNASEEVWVTATRKGSYEWTATLNFPNEGRFEVLAQIEDFYFKDRPVFVSSGTDFTTHSEITTNPASITASQTAQITVQARGSAGVDAASSVGPLSLSATKGTIEDIIDNEDGTYIATYNPPSDVTGPADALISGNFANYGALTDTATITLNVAEWHKYATFKAQANKINEKTGTEITCTIRRANGNSLGSSIGPIAFTTSKGALTAATDNGDGTYTATLTTGGHTSGSATVRATIFGKSTDNSVLVAFEQAPDLTVYSTLTTDSATVTGDGEDVALLTLTLKETSDTNYGASLGALSVTPSTGTIHNITDNENGTYTFHYLPPMTLASSTPVNFNMVINGAYNINKNSVMNIQGIPNFNTSVDITVGEGTLSGYRGYWSQGANHFNNAVSIDEYDPLASYGDYGVLVPNMGQVNTWKLTSIPRSKPNYIMWSRGSGKFLINTYTGYNTQNIDADDYSTNFAFEVATLTPPQDTGKTAVNFKRTDASFTYGAHNQKWTWEIEPMAPVLDSTIGQVYNMALTQEIPINVTYAAHSTVTANPTTIEGDGTQSSTITVQLKTAADTNATVSGGVVTLSATGGSLSPVVDNQDGTYTATYTSINAATHTINATINGVTISDNAEIVVNSSGSVDYISHSTVEVVNDVYDKAVPSAISALIMEESVSGLIASSPGYNFVLNQRGREVDDGDGTTTGYDFGDLNGTGGITTSDALVAYTDLLGSKSHANVELLLKRLSASYGVGSFTDSNGTTQNLWTSKPSCEMLYKDGSSTTKIKVQLKIDETTNATASKGTVTFTGNGTFSDITDNQDGSYTATYRAPVTTQGSSTPSWDLNPETDTIRAFLDGVQILDTTFVELHEPAFCLRTEPTNIPDEVVVGQSFTFNVPVKRQDHALVTGSVGDIIDFVSYTGLPEGARPTITNATDLGNGNYSYLFTAGSVAIQDVTIAPLINANTVNNFLTFVVDIISEAKIFAQHATLTANPSSINLDSSCTVTLQIKNTDGTNFEHSLGTGVTMSLGAGQGGTIGGVTDHKDGTYSAVYTAPSSGGTTSVEVSATINGDEDTLVTDTATIHLLATSFTDQVTITLGEYTGINPYWYGAAYHSQGGSYLFGSMNDNSWAPNSAAHVEFIAAAGGGMNAGGGSLADYYTPVFSLSTMQVGGAYSQLPENIETSFQTMKIHNTTLYRSDASSYTTSTNGTEYKRQWNWTGMGLDGNVFETKTPGVTRVITWDPVD